MGEDRILRKRKRLKLLEGDHTKNQEDGLRCERQSLKKGLFPSSEFVNFVLEDLKIHVYQRF